MKKILPLIIILSILPVATFAYEEKPAYIPAYVNVFSAGSVLAMCVQTGDVLFEQEGFTRRYPASITKIMTALVVLEQVRDLNAPIYFSENAVALPYYAGRMGMEAGESMTVLEALYGIMLPSANEVARALAEHVSGSIGEFVILMNRRAQALGAHDTQFINPCGLPGANQFTTAHDMALIKRAAIENPIYVEIIRTPYLDFPPTPQHEYVRQMRNSNLMVRPGTEEFNTLVIGGKTGFTNAAQHTLITYAAKDDREIILSVLYASPRSEIFSNTALLMDYVFENWKPEEIPEEIPDEETAPVFAYAYDETYTEPYEKPYEYAEESYESRTISDTEALVAASMSLAFAGAALLALLFLRKKLA